MRGSAVIFALASVACGDGGLASISLSTGREYQGPYSPIFERAVVRMPERPRTGVIGGEQSVSLEEIASRCDRVCRTGIGCFGGGSVSSCVRRCTDSTTAEPKACALPVLDALVCLVDRLCALPIDQAPRTATVLNACQLELADALAVEPDPVARTTFCRLPDL